MLRKSRTWFCDYRDSCGREELRYFVSPQDFGVDEINAVSKRVQANVLEAFGLSADNQIPQR